MRMARVNITVPDELLDQARAAGLNVSRLAAAALAEEIDRRVKIAELDAYLAALDVDLGPVPEQELDAATMRFDTHERRRGAPFGQDTITPLLEDLSGDATNALLVFNEQDRFGAALLEPQLRRR